MWHLEVPLHLYKWVTEKQSSPQMLTVDILCCRYNRNTMRFYNFDRLQINGILSSKQKLSITNSCFLCHWRWETKAIHLLRASLEVSDVPCREGIVGPIHSFTAFCKVAFNDGHYGAPHLSPLSAILLGVLAHLGEKCLWGRSYWDRRKSLQQPQEETLGDQGHLDPSLREPQDDEEPEAGFTRAGFPLLTTSVIYYGVQMTVYAMDTPEIADSTCSQIRRHARKV